MSGMDRLSELLPCPFCGGQATVIDDRLGFYVECKGDHAFPIQVYGRRSPELDTPEQEQATDWGALKADAIAAWNRRASQAAPAPFQGRVDPWMQACFGAEVSADKLERGDRLLEEVLELLQSGDYPSERIAMLTSYVWSREIGEPAQEVGGVMVTLAAYCLAHGLDMHDAGETELSRIWTKVEKIRAKQAAKPKGSALPQVWAAPAPSDGLREADQSFVPLYCKGIPADCCDYAVVSLEKQREVCRVWDEADARLIASLLNRAAPTEDR